MIHRVPSSDDERSYRPADRYPELARTGSRQRWVLSRQQLRELGWDRHRVDREIEAGRWALHAPSVVSLHNGPLHHAERLWLGVLHAGRGGALTHVTACARAGLRWTPARVIHVITPKGDLVEPLPGFFFHQTRRPYTRWVVRPADDPPRVDLEHAALLTAERDRSVRRAIGLLCAVVQQRLTTADRLLEASSDIRKLRGGQLMRLALGDVAGGAQSFAEIDIAALCEHAGLAAPARQAMRRDETGRIRFLDLEWKLSDGRRVVVEVDGSFHMDVRHWAEDIKRERSVVLGGDTVLRCTSLEIRLEPGPLLADLERAGVPRRPGRFTWPRSA